MSDTEQKLKKQRDQFLAFAFASSDLFLEISDGGKVLFALGASKGMTGYSDKEMIGKNWLELFSAYDQATLIDMQEKSSAGKRWGPALVALNEEVVKRKGIVTGIKMPGSETFYITLGLSNELMSRLAAEPPARTADLASVNDFIDESTDAMDFARSLGVDAEITLFDFGFTDTIEDEFGPENWGAFQDDLRNFLQQYGLNGANAGKFDNSKYALTHSTEVTEEFLITELTKLIEEHKPEALTTGYVPEPLTVTADLDKISEWDAEKAIDYLVTGFVATEEAAPEFKVETLSGSIKNFAINNKSKIQELQDIIERVDFSLKFTPVMHLQKEEATYYEIVPHFKTGTLREWMMIAEDVGLTRAFDNAFCERAINHVLFKMGGSRTKFSAAISAQSIESPEFHEKLNEHLTKGKAQNLHERLKFEITRSDQIKNVDAAGSAIKNLHDSGYEFILGDAGLNPNTLRNMDRLKVSAIKICQKHIRRVLTDKRGKTSLENLLIKCKKDEINLMAKGIENATQADTLREMGIEYGQGPVYGEAQDTTSFAPPQK